MKKLLPKSPYAAAGAGALLGAGIAGFLGWSRYRSGEITGAQYATSIVVRAVVFGGVTAVSSLSGQGGGGIGLAALSLLGLGGGRGRMSAGLLAGTGISQDVGVAVQSVPEGQGGGSGRGSGRGSGKGAGQGRGGGQGTGSGSGRRGGQDSGGVVGQITEAVQSALETRGAKSRAKAPAIAQPQEVQVLKAPSEVQTASRAGEEEDATLSKGR